LSIGICDLSGDGVGEARRHRGQIAGKGVHLAAFGPDVPGPPGRDRAAVAAHDGIVAEQFPQFPSDPLGASWVCQPAWLVFPLSPTNPSFRLEQH
jgi:hypothetical protein